MERTQIKNEIDRIIEIFGMQATAISKAMNISKQTYYNKRNPNNERDYFNEKNLKDLIRYIKTEADKLSN